VQCSNHPERKVIAKGLCGSCYVIAGRESAGWIRQRPYKEKPRGNPLPQYEHQRNFRERLKRNEPEKWEAYQERARIRARVHRTGVTDEQYEMMLLAQCGRCAICGHQATGESKTERLYVDHDHRTRKLRGLLCHNCNLGIGNLQDDPAIIRTALEYVEVG
jgi:Recombination endonuclease VII